MGLVLLIKDSKSGGCPAVYTTGRQSYVVQGGEVIDPAVFADVESILPGHAFVEVPERLLRRLFQVVGESEGSSRPSEVGSAMRPTLLVRDSTVEGSSAAYASGRGSYVIQGLRVTDPAELTDLVDVLAGEAFVEVPERLLRDVFRLEKA